MSKIAVIGAGISGLASAYYLKDRHDVHVFEQDGRAGGHASTVRVVEPDGTHGVDTAFMVFNRDNYQALATFFDTLGVRTKCHEGGFNFFNLTTGLHFGSAELELERSALEGHYPASFLRIWDDAQRFYNEAPRHFFAGKTFVPIRDYLVANDYCQEFYDSYIIQLCSACWSLPPEKVGDMPASTLIGFFMNHGQSGLGARKVSWETVEGGSISYVEKAVGSLPNGVRLNTAVHAVEPLERGVRVAFDGGIEVFDKVVMACHADQSFRLLARPTSLQQRLLGDLRYHKNEVVLHSDCRVLPEDRARWASWNYGRIELDGRAQTYLVYHMNQIQGLSAKRDFLVSIDCPLELDEAQVIARFDYDHPVIDMTLYERQNELHQLNRDSDIVFAGAYFSIRRAGPDFAGFHESGIASALDAVAAIDRRDLKPVIRAKVGAA